MAESSVVRQILALREGGEVERTHCTPRYVGEHSVAKHSFHMACMLSVLWPDAPGYMYVAILRHDFAERWTGDSPAPVKRRFPDLWRALREADTSVNRTLNLSDIHLTEEEEWWLRGLDMLEFLLWTMDQNSLGNTRVLSQQRSAIRYLEEMKPQLPTTLRDFGQQILTEYEVMGDDLWNQRP